MADQAFTASDCPDYYEELVKIRKQGFRADPKDVCRRFVPNKDELSAVYQTPLTTLLSEKQLPFAVKVTRNFSVPGKNNDVANLKAGSMLMLHFIVRPKRVFATSAELGEVVLPIHAEQLYEVLPTDSAHDDKLFYGTAQVIESNPLPKRLRIVGAMYSDVPEEAQETGEILQVSHVEKHGNIKVLVGRSTLTKQAFVFSELMKESTYSAMISDEHLTLAAIIRKFRVPVRVRKVGKENSVLLLNEVKKEAEVICTEPHKNHVFALALTCPVHLEYISNESIEEVLQATVTQLYPILNWTWGLKEIGKPILPLEQQQTPQPLLGVLCHWSNSKDGSELLSMILDGSPKTKNAKMLALEQKIRKLEKKLSKEPRPLIPPRMPTGKNSDGPTEGTVSSDRKLPEKNSTMYEHALPSPAPLTPHRINVKLDKKEKQQEIAKLKNEKQDLIVSLNKQKVENKAQQSKISQLMEEISRLEKGNYLVQADVHSASNPQYEVPSQRKFSDKSVTDILKFLDGIGLSSYSETFSKESVDGALLCDLVTDGEDIFINELKMKRLHARKLIIEIKRRL